VWDLRVAGVKELDDIVNDEGTADGPMVAPGTYAVRLTVDGRAETRPLQVVDDPRVGATPAELAAAFDFARRTVAKLNELGDAVRRIEAIQKQLSSRVDQTGKHASADRIAAAARALGGKLEAVRAELVDVHSHADQITLHYPVKLYNQLLNVNRMAQSFEKAPTTQSEAVLRELGGQVDAQVARLRAIETTDLAAFNRLMKELDVPAVSVEEAKKPIS
jgi:outer membrane murein-binding lipoprotein Lpp